MPPTPADRRKPTSREVPEGRSDAAVLARERRYRRLLACADIAAAALAVAVGVVILGRDDAVTPAILVALPLVLLVSKTLGLYDRDEHVLRKTTLDEAPALFQVATLYALLIWLGENVFVLGALGKGQVLGLWGLLFLAMLAARMTARRLARAGSAEERCLVVGDAETASHLKHKLAAVPALHAIVVGRVPLDSSGPPASNGLPVLGGVDTLGLKLVEHDVDRVLIAPSEAGSDDFLDVIRLVKSLGVRVSVVPRLTEVVGSSVEFDDIEGVTLLGLRRYGLSRSSRRMKRTLDVAGATAGLLLLAPLLGAIAVAVKLGSPGPVLFRQHRVGMEGEAFEIRKFRTMVDGADEGRAALAEHNETDGLFKIADDPRLTPVGRFLRRSSLDELPQLINVLRGEMSLVGPRPLVPDEDRRVEGFDRRRLQVMPGVTGAWQVYGSGRIPLREMVVIDYLYGANWSLWLDVKILLRTIPHAMGLRNQ